jgi:hypothetical protein
VSLLVRARVWHQLQICHRPTVPAGCDSNWCLTPEGFSRYGVIQPIHGDRCRGLPTALPASTEEGRASPL